MASSQGIIEADNELIQNGDSDYETSSGFESSSTSLSETISKYIFENGRRYQAYFGIEKNPMPNDEKEQDRIDLIHEVLLKSLDGELHLAPLSHPQRIIDIGTGTGIWAIDVADRYPMAEVTGTDLSPIQPPWVPPNCHFLIDDAEKPWVYPSGHFDFIHARNLAQAITHWPELVGEMFRTTKAGGYVELADVGGKCYCDDGSSTLETNGYEYNVHLVSKALTSIGRPPATGAKMKKLLEEAGFVDVVVKEVKQPIGPWPKDPALKMIGAMNLLSLESGIEAYSLATLNRILGMEVEKVKEICKNSWAAAKNRRLHVYGYFYVVYGRKPE